MDIYDCIEEVNYGRIDYHPDNKDGDKNKTITLPVGTPVDDTIKTKFKKRGGGHARPSKTEALKIDNLQKVQNDGAMKTLKSMCEAKGIVVGDDWTPEQMQTALENPPTTGNDTSDEGKPDRVLPEDMDRLNKEALQEACKSRNIPFEEDDIKADLRDKLTAWAGE